jgi:hypothetical protein
MTLKSKYRELLGMEDQRTTAVSAAVYDICEYLVELADDDRLDTDFGPVEATAIYRWLSPRHSS